MAEHDPINTKEMARAKAKAESAEAIEAKIEEDDVKWLMSHKQGRRHAYRLLANAGVWLSSFNTNNAAMAFNEGRRSYGVQFLTLIMQHCPDQYIVMLKEHKAK